MRIRNTIALVLGLCLGAVLATAQPLTGSVSLPETGEADPCANIGTPSNPYTMGNCWNCYTSKIKDCDRQFGEPAARQACYTGATSLLTFCLNQTVPPNPASPRPKGNVHITGRDLTYSTYFQYPPSVGSVKVMRASDLSEISGHVWYSGNRVTVTVDAADLPSESGVDFGLITTVNNAQGVLGAEATAYRSYDPADLDMDGSVDMFDLIEAYDSDTVDLDQFLIDFVSAR